jgi:hypothetical protein
MSGMAYIWQVLGLSYSNSIDLEVCGCSLGTADGTVQASALNMQHSALSTQHQHSASSTSQHSASTPALSTQHSASALGFQHSALSTSTPRMQHLSALFEFLFKYIQIKKK